MYPKNGNYCIQLYPKLQKCVSHVYPNFFFICSPSRSVPQSVIPFMVFMYHMCIPRFQVCILCVSQKRKMCIPR